MNTIRHDVGQNAHTKQWPQKKGSWIWRSERPAKNCVESKSSFSKSLNESQSPSNIHFYHSRHVSFFFSWWKVKCTRYLHILYNLIYIILMFQALLIYIAPKIVKVLAILWDICIKYDNTWHRDFFITFTICFSKYLDKTNYKCFKLMTSTIML